MEDILLKRKTLDQIDKVKKRKNLKYVIIDILGIILGLMVFVGIVVALYYNA